MIFSWKMNVLKVELLSNGIFCYSYIEGYGGRGLLICDVIFREGVGKFVTWVWQGGGRGVILLENRVTWYVDGICLILNWTFKLSIFEKSDKLDLPLHWSWVLYCLPVEVWLSSQIYDCWNVSWLTAPVDLLLHHLYSSLLMNPAGNINIDQDLYTETDQHA